jgi:hypothetical protein
VIARSVQAHVKTKPAGLVAPYQDLRFGLRAPGECWATCAG